MRQNLSLKTILVLLLASSFIFVSQTYAKDLDRSESNLYAYQGDCQRSERRMGKRGRREDRREYRRHNNRPGHHRGLFFSNPEFMKKELNLSDTQIEKIGKINLNFKKQHLDIKEKLVPKKIQLRKILLDEKINLSKVKATLRIIEKYNTDLAFLRIKHRVEIEKVLTKDQKNKLRNERKFKRGNRRYNRR